MMIKKTVNEQVTKLLNNSVEHQSDVHFCKSLID